MRDRFPMFFISGLLMLGGFGAFVIGGAKRGSFADRLSTYRSEKNGSRALYLFLENDQLPVKRWQQDFRILDADTTLVMLGIGFENGDETPAGRTDGGTEDTTLSAEDKEELKDRGLNAFRSPKVSDDESQALLAHIRDGGTLLYAPMRAEQNQLLEALDVFLDVADAPSELTTLVPAQPSRYTAHVERLEARVSLWLDLPPGAVPLLVDEERAKTVLGLVPLGAGRVLVLGAPELAMNSALQRADNALFWRTLAHAVTPRRGVLAFDEFHHGFTGERSIAEFATRYGIQFAGAQLLLGIVFWATSLKRFGRARPPPDDVRIGATDALLATSRLYRDGRHFGHAAHAIAKELLTSFAKLAGVSPRSEVKEVASALESRGRRDLASAITHITTLALATTTEPDVEEVARLAAVARLQLNTKSKKGSTS
jgi:hypothetical protein